METIQAYERLLDIPGKVIFSDNIYLIIQQFAFQPEARPSLPSLVFSLHSMYNSALPGEYLELSLPTLPTPPSSTENSSNQFIPTSRQINNEYLTPKETSDTYKSLVTPPTNHNPGSPPNNHHPADNPHSDLPSPAGYQNRLFTNKGWDMNEYERRYTFNQQQYVNSFVSPRLVSEVKPIEICKMLAIEKNKFSKENHSAEINHLSRAKRSYSESSYEALPTHFSLAKRGSSESGYGTTTTRSSVSSDKDRLCYKCRHVEDNDDVFFKEGEEEVGERKLVSDSQPGGV